MPGNPSMKILCPVARDDVEDDVPALAVPVVRPGVVAHDGLAVPGVAAGGHERAAAFRDRDGLARGGVRMLFSIPRRVAGEFEPGVHRDHVPEVQFDPIRLQALRQSPSVRSGTPASTLGQSTFSAAARKNGQSLEVSCFSSSGDHPLRIGDLRRQQVTVLETDVGGAPLQVHEHPSVLLRVAPGRISAARPSGPGAGSSETAENSTSALSGNVLCRMGLLRGNKRSKRTVPYPEFIFFARLLPASFAWTEISRDTLEIRGAL